MWRGVVKGCSLNSLAAIQRYSHHKFLNEPHTSNQSEEAKVTSGSSRLSIGEHTSGLLFLLYRGSKLALVGGRHRYGLLTG